MKSKRLRAGVVESLENRCLFSTYLVTSAADSGVGTLRQAILDANANAGVSDTINFSIASPVSGIPVTISPDPALPAITDSVTIDGTTQPGYSGKPLIYISGTVLSNDPFASGSYGLLIQANNVTVRGLGIGGFTNGTGISIAFGTGNKIESNYIGTDAYGTKIAADLRGIYVGTGGNTIGGATAAQGNVISGSSLEGLNLASTSTLPNLVQNNYIGTNAAGTAAIANATGITTAGVGTIGGSSTTGNIIAGSQISGISVNSASPDANSYLTVSYNQIGVGVNGVALGNGSYGINIGANAGNGQWSRISNNHIAYNGNDGIAVSGTSAVHAQIVTNSIHDNSGLGIDLGTSGVTPNDSNDLDTGANGALNFPSITSVVASADGTTATISLSLSTQPSNYNLHVYANDAADASGNGEGKTYLGAVGVTVGSTGTATAVLQLPTSSVSGKFLSATTTQIATFQTSEFSPDFEVQTATGTLLTTVADVTGNYTLPAGRTVFIDANNNGVLDSGEKNLTTSGAGSDSFGQVAPGTYTLCQILPPGYAQAYPYGGLGQMVTVTGGGTTNALFYTRNAGLTPNVGGPYTVAEGSSVTLNASGSTITTGTITKYEWDFDYDGASFAADATGATATFSAATIDGPLVRQIALRLVDSNSDYLITPTKVNITNASPTALFSPSVPTINAGQIGLVGFGMQNDVPADVSAGFRYSFDFNNDGVFEITDQSGPSGMQATVPSSYLPVGVNAIRGRIKDKDGEYTDYTTTITVNPVAAAPTANAGGPYTLTEGSSISLNASGSTAGTGTINKYEWDLDYDGVTFTADATVAAPAFSAASLDGPSSKTVALRVTNSSNVVSPIKTATVSITNAAPTAKFTWNQVLTTGLHADVDFTNLADPSSADFTAAFRLSVDFNNDGDFIDAGEFANYGPTNAATTGFQYDFASAGTRTVHGRITDKDGAFTDYYTSVTVGSVTVTPPSAPTGMTVTPNYGNRVTIAWTDASTNETGFEIQRSASYVFSSPTVFTAAASATSFVDTTTTPSSYYYYRVRAVNSAGPSAYTSSIKIKTPSTTAPGVTVNAPSVLGGQAVSGTQVNLAWIDNATNETGFQLQRSTSSSFTSPTTFTFNTANTNLYSDTTVVAGTTYYYRVLAFSGGTNSAWSNTATITTPAGVTVNAPSALHSAASVFAGLGLAWTDNSSNETGWELQRSLSASFSSPTTFTINTPNSPFYTDGTVTQGSTYFYRVRAVAGSTPSAWSATATLTYVGSTTLIEPSNLKATASSSTQVALSWTDNSTNETGFQIWRSTSPIFDGPTSFTVNTPNATSYTDVTAAAGTTYYYQVRALGSGGMISPWSASATVTTPTGGGATTKQATPTGFSVTALAGALMKLAWTDNATAETGYEIQVSTVFDFSTTVKDITVPTANLSTYTVTGLSTSTWYYFRVRAITTPATLDSAWTSSIKLKTLSA